MINFYNMDCMTLMKEKQNQFYDLAIVDPPYYSNAKKIITPGGRLTTNGVERRKYPMPHWEPPTTGYWKDLLRISKHQIIWGINYYTNLPALGPGRIVWDKVKDNGTDFSDCEIAYCSRLNHVKIVRYMWDGMRQAKSLAEGSTMQGNKRLNVKRIHPTQKPVALYKWLLDLFASSGDRILDTHAGSGSSIIACMDMGYDIDACEIDPHYYGMTQKRIDNHARQQQFNLEK